MNRLINSGQIIFGIGMIGFSALCFIHKDFIVGRPPGWPDQLNPVLGYVSGTALLGLALAIIVGKKGAWDSLVIAVMILTLSVFRHGFYYVGDYLNAFKTLALLGGALIMTCSYLKEGDTLAPVVKSSDRFGKTLVITGCIFLAVFFIAAGYAHFKFFDFVTTFIPEYIPFRPFWAAFTGVCLIAGGIGVVIPQTRKWAALLSGTMVMGWFFLLHIPRFLANMNDKSDQLGFVESFTIAGIFFVLAGISGKTK